MSASIEPLWKAADVAKFLSMSKSWVYKEAEADRLPHVYIGASLRFRPEAIRRHLEQLTRSNVHPFRQRPDTGTI